MSNIIFVFVMFFPVMAQAKLPLNFQYQITTEEGLRIPLAEICFELEQDTITASDSAYDYNFEIRRGGMNQLEGVLTPTAVIGDNNNPFSVPFAVACRSALNFLEEFKDLIRSQNESDFFNQENINLKWEAAKYLVDSLHTYFQQVSRISRMKRAELNQGELDFRQAMLLLMPGFILTDSSKYLIARQAGVFEAMANYQFIFSTPAVFDPIQIAIPIYRQDSIGGTGFIYFSSAPIDSL